MPHVADDQRYDSMTYRRVGRSGLKLPALSLGLWHNFGGDRRWRPSARSCAAPSTSASPTSTWPTTTARRPAPPRRPSARTWPRDFAPYRDELVISTKAGYCMWPGPYGEWGSRKYLLSSLDQSLTRMGLDYVDIFYSHRPDPETPLEETMGALHSAVQQGKALYVGVSNYSPEQTREAAAHPRASWAPRCSSTSRATRCSTAGSRTACWTPSTSWRSAPSPSPRWRRAC